MASNYTTYCLDKDGRPTFQPDGKPDLKNGELYVSVSTILSVENVGDFLTRWLLTTFGKEPNPLEAHEAYMDKVSSLGTRLHHFFELDLKGRRSEADKIVSDDMIPGIESYFRWKKQHDVELIDSEKILFSKKLRIAGTRDLKIKVDGQVYIADWKTGSVADKAFAQLAIYHYLGREMGEKDNKDAKLLVLGGNRDKIANGGDVYMHTVENWFGPQMTEADLFAWFLCLRHVWMLKNLKSRKFAPVIKGLQESIDPMIERFKLEFTEAI